MINRESSTEKIDVFEGVVLADDALRSVIADLQLGVLIQGARTEILYCNRAAAELLGVSEENMLGKTFTDPQWDVIQEDGRLFPPADHPAARVIRTGLSARGVVMGVHRPSGRDLVWLDVNADPLADSDGRVSRVVCAFSDITARKVAEQRMREGVEYFRIMADTAPVLIWVSGPDMMTTFFNKPWLEFTGRTMEQELGLGWAEGVHPEDLDRCLSIYRSAFEARKDFVMEYRLRRFDGEYRQLLDQGVPWWMPDGSLAGYIGCGTDVTDLKRAREAASAAQHSLAISEEVTNRILESSRDCIKILDLDGNILYMNPGGARVLEIDDLSPIIGTDWTAFYSGADRLAAREAITKARAGGIGTMQGECSTNSGAVKWWDCLATPITNGQGEVERLLVISRDITASKKAEEDLRIALEEVQRLKDQLHQENVYLQEEIKLEHNFEEIVGQTEAIKRVLYKIEQVAPLDTTVLILGETGSGKELVARAIHSLSARKNRPLVKVNCAALPGSLIESELFGHEKGAFTDAHTRKIGRFELANAGTIFLDEVGELPMDLQAKLLRVLQDGEFERLGSSTTIRVDTRILAASNRDLKAEMREGRFREDLWYRLSVFPITVPPLRERSEDIPLLVRSFVAKLAKKLGKSIKAPSSQIIHRLQSYSWPGNVRELANVIERAIIDARGDTLDLTDGLEAVVGNPNLGLVRSLEDLEREFIIETLRQTRGKIEGNDGAARSLGLNPSTLRTRMKKLGIQRRTNGGSFQPAR